MSRIKTTKQSEEKREARRRSNKIQKGNPYTQAVVKSVDTSQLDPVVMAMIMNTKRGWVTRNTKCPCGSFRRFKNCCMTWERG